MARSFAGASSQYLRNLAAPVTAAPLTMACWARTTDVTNNKTLMGLGNTAITNRFTLAVNSSERVTAATQSASGTGTATSAGSSGLVTSGEWFHAAGVFYSASSRAVFTTRYEFGSTDKGTNSTNTTPTGIDRVVVGSFAHLVNYWDGQIAEAAIWDVALTDAEVQALGQKYLSPLQVRPENLVAYWPLVGRYSPEIDLVGGFNLTLGGAPVAAEHPRIYYPKVPLIFPSIDLPHEGEVAQSLPKVIQSVAGETPFIGAVAQTLPRLAQAASGVERLTGLVSQTLPKTQQAVVAKDRFTATVAQVVGKVTQSAQGAERHPAAVAQVAPKAVQAAAGKETMRATVAQVLPAVAQAAASEHADISVDGASTQALPSVEQAALAAERATAAVGQTLPTPQQATQSGIILPAQVAQVAPPVGQAAIGSERLAGVVAQVVPKARQNADGTITYAGHAGSVAQVLAFLQQEIAAEVTAAINQNTDWIIRRRRRRM